MKRVSNSSFTVNVGDYRMRVEKATLSIEDGRAPVTDGGVPNGFIDAEVSAGGELELDATARGILAEAAKSAGSWQGIELVDIQFYAKGTTEEQKVEAFGCLLNISDLPDYDPGSKNKAITKMPYQVTSPDFVRIDGVPYLEEERTKDLVE